MLYNSLFRVTWYDELRQFCPHIPAICVANKIDLDPSVTSREFLFATERKLPIIFASAADGTNVVRVFREAVALAANSRNNPTDEIEEELKRLIKST